MLEFLKHHWTKKEKLLARVGSMRMLLALTLGIAAAGLFVLWQAGKDGAQLIAMRSAASQVQETTQAPPGTRPIGGPFDLVNQDGKPVTDAAYRGKFKLIYFGYTYCPDMCPTGLQSMGKALDQLGTDADKVAALFITIDPARDTPDKLKAYVAEFHPKIQGLTGTDQQVAAAAAAYQVYYAKGEKVDGEDYVMDHSSLIYLMGPDDKLITTFPEEVDPAAIASAVKGQMIPESH